MNDKPKVLVFIYNKNKIGGPTVSMRLLQNSSLKEKYSFKEIYIDGQIGKVPKIKLIRRLSKEIKRESPDIIHVTGLQLQGFYAVLASRMAKKRNIVLAIRGSSTDAINFSMLSRFLFRFIIEPITMKLSKKVYTVCDAMRDKKLVKKNTKKNMYGTIHNAAPLIDDNALNNKYVRKEFKINNNDLIFVYTGRVTREKGIHILLSAFSKLRHENIKLIICGDGPDYKALNESNNNKNIIFTGHRNDVSHILNESDVFVFPTLHENLSNSLLEAASLGKGIIATNVGGNPEVIEDGKNGILVNANSIEEFEKAMNIYIENPKLINKYGTEAILTVKNKFNQDILTEKIDKLYKSVLTGD